jgi:hypothetical protein
MVLEVKVSFVLTVVIILPPLLDGVADIFSGLNSGDYNHDSNFQ